MYENYYYCRNMSVEYDYCRYTFQRNNVQYHFGKKLVKSRDAPSRRETEGVLIKFNL